MGRGKTRERFEEAQYLLNFRFARPVVRETAKHRLQSHPQDSSPSLGDGDFVRATFRFGCSPTGDPAVDAVLVTSLVDPDTAPPWASVQVVFADFILDQIPACPICLDAPPLCPRIGKCGHFMCFTCALRYFTLELSNSSNKQTRCPLCFENMAFEDLRMVKFKMRTGTVAVGHHLEFVLVRRIKGHSDVLIADADEEQASLFKNVLLFTDVPESIGFERHQLKKARDDLKEIGGLDAEQTLPFVEMALVSLDNAEVTWHNSQIFRDAFREPPSLGSANVLENDVYLFYQAIDGEHLYLHSLNYRSLVAEFGADNIPSRVSGEVLEMENYQQNDKTKKKWRFLQHLPLFTQFSLCEVDLSHLLSIETKSLIPCF
jgi:hypothetical protein